MPNTASVRAGIDLLFMMTSKTHSRDNEAETMHVAH